MKKTIIFSVVAFALITIACKNTTTKIVNDAVQTFNLDTTRLKSGEPFYQCTMDPEVLSEKPGACPKCGMDLTEMKKH